MTIMDIFWKFVIEDDLLISLAQICVTLTPRLTRDKKRLRLKLKPMSWLNLKKSPVITSCAPSSSSQIWSLSPTVWLNSGVKWTRTFHLDTNQDKLPCNSLLSDETFPLLCTTLFTIMFWFGPPLETDTCWTLVSHSFSEDWIWFLPLSRNCRTASQLHIIDGVLDLATRPCFKLVILDKSLPFSISVL